MDELALGQARQGTLRPRAAPHGCFGPDSFQDFFDPLLSRVTALQVSFTMKASQCPWPSLLLMLRSRAHYSSSDLSNVWLLMPASSLFPRFTGHCSWYFLANFVLSASVLSYWWLDQRLMSLAGWYILANLFLDYLNTTNLRDRHTLLPISIPSSFEYAWLWPGVQEASMVQTAWAGTRLPPSPSLIASVGALCYSSSTVLS